MDTIGTRIRHARKLRNLTQEDVAKHFGISRVSVAQWEGRGNSPEPDKIPGLARLLSTTSDWLLEAKGSAPTADDIRDLERTPIEDRWEESEQPDERGYDIENYQPRKEGGIPELDAKAGAGEGAIGEVLVLPMESGTKSAHKIIDEWVIPTDYLRDAVRDPSRAVVMGIQGDSMLPNYAPGDKVVVDLTEHELRVDGVYLISDGWSAPQIKRLQRVLFSIPPQCKIISDNPNYEAQEVDVAGVKILGKVAAYIGRR